MPRKGKGKKEEEKEKKLAKPTAKTDKLAAKKEGTPSSTADEAAEAAIPSPDEASIASTTEAPAKTAKPVARLPYKQLSTKAADSTDSSDSGKFFHFISLCTWWNSTVSISKSYKTLGWRVGGNMSKLPRLIV